MLPEITSKQRLASRIRAEEFGNLCPQPVSTFWHGGQGLADLEISPSGQFVSTLTTEEQCTVWNSTTQQAEIKQPGSHSMAWSADGRYFAIGLKLERVLLFRLYREICG